MHMCKIPTIGALTVGLLGGWLALPAGAALAQSAATPAVPLGPNPSECEIQAALFGAAGPGCPPIVMKRPPPPPPAPAPASPPAPVAVPALPGPPPDPPVAALKAGLRAAFRIGFDFNSARIRPESRAVLDRIGAVMTAPEAATARFRIVGHTDAVGGDTANRALSQRRADAVADYLAERHGVRRDRLDTAGMGAREPLLPKTPKAAENRRVEIVNLGG
ncbi:outer membrane protein OmpA-like peptidoglycan-associated protein [Azospirillum brasilense]|nr:outer membrane protein OmpA-like peptidoglycan-associated protein [Azospirillum brasilense]